MLKTYHGRFYLNSKQSSLGAFEGVQSFVVESLRKSTDIFGKSEETVVKVGSQFVQQFTLRRSRPAKRHFTLVGCTKCFARCWSASLGSATSE
jgi:hypothetical protein